MTRAAAIAVAVLVALPCFGGAPVYEFDDSLAQYVATTYEGVLGTNSRSVSMWVKTSSRTSGTFQPLLSWGKHAVSGGAWRIRLSGSTGQLRLELQGSGIELGPAIDDDEWHHIATVLDSDGTPQLGDCVLYVDGIGYTTANSLAVNTIAESPVWVARMNNNVGSPFYLEGSAYAAKIHNRALSAAEVRGEYVEGGGRNTFGALSVVLPRANDESVVYTLDAPVLTANLNTGKVLAEDAVIASKDAARNYGLAKGGVTVGSATISTPAP